MATSNTQNLGTIFTGKIDASFLNALKAIKTAIGDVNKAMDKTTGKTSTAKGAKETAKGMTLVNEELTEYQKLLGGSLTENKKFQDALANMTAQYGKSGTALRVHKQALFAEEKQI